MAVTYTVRQFPETGSIVVRAESPYSLDATRFDVFGWTEYKEPDCHIADVNAAGVINLNLTIDHRVVFYYVEKGISREDAEEAIGVAEGKAVRLGTPINLLAAYARYQRGVRDDAERNES